MTQLSKREVFLLFFMAVFVTGALFYVFLLTPLSLEIAENREQLNQLEFRKLQTETNLGIIPQLRTRRDVKIEETAAVLSTISNPLHAAEFERWLLPVLAEHNARVVSVSLSETQVATPELLYTQVSPQVYRLLELIQDYNNVTVTPITPLPESTTQMLYAEYSYQFTSTFENFINIVDEVKEFDTTYFVSNALYDLNNREGSITVRVYSVHKLTEEELLDIYKGDFGNHPNEVTGPDVPSNPK